MPAPLARGPRKAGSPLQVRACVSGYLYAFGREKRTQRSQSLTCGIYVGLAKLTATPSTASSAPSTASCKRWSAAFGFTRRKQHWWKRSEVVTLLNATLKGGELATTGDIAFVTELMSLSITDRSVTCGSNEIAPKAAFSSARLSITPRITSLG